MTDPRITEYYQATTKMKNGSFPIKVTTGGDDDIGLLGQSLLELATTIEKKFQEINYLVEITEKINAGLFLDEVLEHVYSSFQPLIPYDRIGFSLIEDNCSTVRARWAKSKAPVMKITAGYEAPLQGSSLQDIMKTERPRILNDLEAYLKDHPKSDATEKIVAEGMRSSLTCPLKAMGKPIGFMFFSSMQKNTYEKVHVELFLQIAGQLSAIVEKSRLYQQLSELNDIKNKFLGIAAHDLRNPISVIKGYLKLFMGGIVGDVAPKQQEIFVRMDRTCETMLALINDLLDVSAIEAGKLDLELNKVNLHDYLHDNHESNRLLAEAKSISLKLQIEPDLPEINIDEDRINQVINNLITNAIKFSYPDTEITLKAERNNNTIEISVADQGQGIPREEIPKVFAEFGRLSVRPTAGEKSTGLGLAIVKRMVEAHKGKIWVKSEQGKGSTFTFSLPMV